MAGDYSLPDVLERMYTNQLALEVDAVCGTAGLARRRRECTRGAGDDW